MNQHLRQDYEEGGLSAEATPGISGAFLDEAIRPDNLAVGPQAALELTQAARDAKKAAQDAAIEAGRAAGKSNRRVAREVGVVEGTVRNKLKAGAQETHSAEITQPPSPTREMEEMSSPRARRWHAALTVLREMNLQAS